MASKSRTTSLNLVSLSQRLTQAVLQLLINNYKNLTNVLFCLRPETASNTINCIAFFYYDLLYAY